jgi:hypothetical protein
VELRRRERQQVADPDLVGEPRAGGDMTTDIWIAPGLRYLPVRFLIRPDPESYFDLMLDRRPELAGPEEPPRRNPP